MSTIKATLVVAAVCKMPIWALLVCAVRVEGASLCPPVNKLYIIYIYFTSQWVAAVMTLFLFLTKRSDLWSPVRVSESLYPAIVYLVTTDF